MSLVLPGQLITPAYRVDSGVVQRYLPSRGTILTYVESGSSPRIPVISATTLGRVVYSDVSQGDTTDSTKTSLVTVLSKTNAYVAHDATAETATAINLPREHDTVLVRITKITTRQAYCEILSVEGYGNVLADSGAGANGEHAHRSVPYGGGTQAFSSHQSVASSQLAAVQAAANDVGESFKGIIRYQDVRSTDRDKVRIIDSFKPGDIVRAVIISLGDGSNYYLSTARNDLGVLFAKSENGSGDLMFPVDWQTMVDRTSGVMESRKCAKPFSE